MQLYVYFNTPVSIFHLDGVLIEKSPSNYNTIISLKFFTYHRFGKYALFTEFQFCSFN